MAGNLDLWLDRQGIENINNPSVFVETLLSVFSSLPELQNPSLSANDQLDFWIAAGSKFKMSGRSHFVSVNRQKDEV